MGVVFAQIPDVYRSAGIVRDRAPTEGGVRFWGQPSSGRTLGSLDRVELSALAQSLSRGAENGRHGVTFIDKALQTLSDIEGLVDQMEGIATRASRGVGNLDADFQAAKTELTRIADETKFGDRVLLDGTFSTQLQISLRGDTAERLTVALPSVTAAALGLGSASVTNMATADDALEALSAAGKTLAGHRDTIEASRSRVAGALSLAEGFETVTRGNLTRYRAALLSSATEVTSEEIHAKAAQDLVGPDGRPVLSTLGAARLSEVHGDIVALEDAVRVFQRALGTGTAADMSSHRAHALSDENLNLVAKQASQLHLRADADRVLGTVDELKGLRSGTFYVNSKPIAIDIDKDTLNDVLRRINESSATVSAKLIGRDQRLQIDATDDTSSFTTQSNGTAFFEVVHVVQGARSARTTEVQPKRAAAALADMGDAVNRLFRHMDAAGSFDALARLRASVTAAFQSSARTVASVVRTDLGFALDFRAEATTVFSFEASGKARFEQVLRKAPEQARGFFLGTDGSRLLGTLLSQLGDAQDEVGLLLDRANRLVDGVG